MERDEKKPSAKQPKTEPKSDKAFVTMEHALLAKAKDKITEDTWLADSAASSHMTDKMDGMYDIEWLKDHQVLDLDFNSQF